MLFPLLRHRDGRRRRRRRRDGLKKTNFLTFLFLKNSFGMQQKNGIN